MSDILIKNMEMPKSCGECKLAVNAYGSQTEGKCAVLGYGVTYLRKRHDACPLVEVPPHGRLKDESVILENMEKVFCDSFDKKNEEILGKMNELYQRAVFEAPTIVEANT